VVSAGGGGGLDLTRTTSCGLLAARFFKVSCEARKDGLVGQVKQPEAGLKFRQQQQKGHHGCSL